MRIMQFNKKMKVVLGLIIGGIITAKVYAQNGDASAQPVAPSPVPVAVEESRPAPATAEDTNKGMVPKNGGMEKRSKRPSLDAKESNAKTVRPYQPNKFKKKGVKALSRAKKKKRHQMAVRKRKHHLQKRK